MRTILHYHYVEQGVDYYFHGNIHSCFYSDLSLVSQPSAHHRDGHPYRMEEAYCKQFQDQLQNHMKLLTKETEKKKQWEKKMYMRERGRERDRERKMQE